MAMETHLKFDKRRHKVKTCPCGKSNKDGKFAPFQGHDVYGHCFSCGENFFPPEDQKCKVQSATVPVLKISFTSADILKKSLAGYEHNGFAVFLAERFGTEAAEKLIARYFIGTTRKGGTVFWQIDSSGRIRGGKVIQYDPQTGKRRKDVHPTWTHTLMNVKDYHLQQCLFGEHLLKKNRNPVAVVESEKTAVISSLYFPDFVWLACGGKEGLKAKKMEVLKGRKVILFPDVDGYGLWCEKADELSPMLDITVSDLIEKKASPEEREGKFDLADYLLKFNPEDFYKKNDLHKSSRLNDRQAVDIKVPPENEPDFDLAGNLIDPEKGYPVSWDLPTSTPLERMIQRNPHLKTLIDKLDLVQLN
jgi:hypothetical protein